MTRETKTARIELRTRPSLKSRAEKLVESHPDYQTLSEVMEDLLIKWVRREERQES